MKSESGQVNIPYTENIQFITPALTNTTHPVQTNRDQQQTWISYRQRMEHLRHDADPSSFLPSAVT
jgi:hypothetical protein